MPRHRLNSYLKTNRLKAALSQRELGELLGLGDTAVSNYETEFRSVPARVLVASEIIFGVGAAELFPALYEVAREDLAARALKLAKRLEGREDPASRKKLKALSGVTGQVCSADV